MTAAAAAGDAELVRLAELDGLPAGDRPGRTGPPSPAKSAAGTRMLHDAEAHDELDDDRRGDGDPRLASRTAGYGSAESLRVNQRREGVPPARHADAGGRSPGSSPGFKGIGAPLLRKRPAVSRSRHLPCQAAHFVRPFGLPACHGKCRVRGSRAIPQRAPPIPPQKYRGGEWAPAQSGCGEYATASCEWLGKGKPYRRVSPSQTPIGVNLRIAEFVSWVSRRGGVRCHSSVV